MSLFKKPKAKINVRVNRDDSDDEETKNDKPVDDSCVESLKKSSISIGDENSSSTTVVNSEPSVSSTKSSSQSGVGEKKFDPKVKLKLSFGDDDEEETDVFQVKKSAYSRRITKQLKREKKRKEKEDKLDETKRSDRPEKPSIDEPIFTFESNIKEDSKSPTSEPEPSFKKPDFHTIDISSHQFNSTREGHIPSAKEIYAARKKREEDRKKMKMDNIIDDFISIEEETAAERAALGHKDDEQPVYEEEADNDDEDDDDRIDFAVDREAIERNRAREAFIQAQEEDKSTLNRARDIKDSDESEDELDLWEKEQIRKGVGFSIGSTNRDQQPNNHLNDLMTKLDLPSTIDKGSSSSSIPNYLPKIPSSKATEEHIKQLSDDICESISQLNREIAEDEQELKSIRAEREQLMAEVKELEEKMKESGLEDDSPNDLLRNWKKGQTFNPNMFDKYDSSDDDY